MIVNSASNIDSDKFVSSWLYYTKGILELQAK
jgi:hypothetical protein